MSKQVNGHSLIWTSRCQSLCSNQSNSPQRQSKINEFRVSINFLWQPSLQTVLLVNRHTPKKKILAVTAGTHNGPYVSDVLHSIDICIKNIRCATAKKTKKSVLGLGGRKVGRRIASIFISLITPSDNNCPHCRAFPICWGHFGVEHIVKTLPDLCHINLSIMGWGIVPHQFTHLDLSFHPISTPMGALLSSIAHIICNTFEVQ